MDELEKEIQKEVNVRNFLLTFVDLGMYFVKATDERKFYRKSINDYFKWREKDGYEFSRRLYYLKKKKLIKVYIKGKKTYLELTRKGKSRASFYLNRSRRIKKKMPKWDGKWRMAIFDIPESKRDKRDTLRRWLKHLGLIELQKSIYIYPYDFKKELDCIVDLIAIWEYVKYMITDIIQGEEGIISKFIERNLLKYKDLKRSKE